MRNVKVGSVEPKEISRHRARRIWLDAQGFGRRIVSGKGPKAVTDLVRHLGYVQIDTINVVERCHHHILFTRLPTYSRSDLHKAQSKTRGVFEYWAHALAYIASEDYRFFMPAMLARKASPHLHYPTVLEDDTRRLLERIDREGPISIRDIEDDVLVEKDHAWASRKPSRKVLSKAFFDGSLTVCARSGMLKSYDLTARHFGWTQSPEPASAGEVDVYVLERALRAQGIISLDSVCHLDAGRKPAIRALIEERVAAGSLTPVILKGDRTEHWAAPEALEKRFVRREPEAHVLSPFDPLVIQRKRLELFFGYAHRFEAYVPAEKRVLGYFALPVLYDGRIVAAIDIKAERKTKTLLINKWTRFGEESPEERSAVEAALGRFEQFQFAP
ncbi:winged helix-turn-helix domain-containing protein [Rhizobium sp. TRM95796]|uniref:winged helix-turn-helix domain-containing protein n=1 Tax=Rhizobium sp. TRM95796 TaxID=2979862 RepID=UPI0021E856D1|nr:crosslink repair DNA glycosylase YcaQ family protein [Rhizobium sp. TRM95796]MCV3766495.1 winged helix DNA-binding domain-containing protein [Rhizobium sp. TRM95796]